MKLPLLLLAGAVAGSLPLAARERLPIETFARTPDTSRARLSPDGKHFSFLREYEGRPTLHIGDPDGGPVLRFGLGEAPLANGAEKQVGEYQWVGNNRLLITTVVWDSFYGVVAVDADARNATPISGYESDVIEVGGPRLFAHEVIHRFLDKESQVLMLDRHENNPGSANRPDVVSVNTTDGTTYTLLKNPGEVSAWGVAPDGTVRFGLMTHGALSGAIYRETEKSPWKTILPLERRAGNYRPIGFDAAGNRVFLAGETEQKRRTIFPMDLATGQIGAPLLADPEYDILPERGIPGIDGHALNAPIFSPRHDRLLGVRYVTDAPRVKWFDREMARIQAAVDHALPDTVNLLVDISQDGKRMLWFGYSDQNPGVYFLADLEKHSFRALARTCSWIKPAEMAQTLNSTYQARDGLVIHGFLTVPPGHAPKNLPLVVLPHGGPWVRDVWGYDPFVQLLANRGYAVLQMNYRGSPGYGEKLFAEARRQIGGEIQDDIEDATRWAIKTGLADPKRIAIVGMSYGGYSALFALGHNPELYRCGISIAGVTDWPRMYSKSDVAGYKEARRYWVEQIGDPEKDAAKLAAISPVNFADQITAPVLIIQGKEDRRVPPDQARRMIAALEKAGRKPDTLFLSGVAHNLGHVKDRIQMFTTVTAFLEKNLGPGVE